MPERRPDMVSYTDAKGSLYEIDASFTEGDIVILSTDKSAFKMRKTDLAEAR